MPKVNWSDFHAQHQQRKTKQKLLDKKRGKKGDAFKPSPWAERLKYFKLGEEPTRLRIIPNGDDSIHYTYYSRWVKINGNSRNVISNSWNGERALPCVLYYYAAEEENPNLLASPNYCMTVLVLEDFFKIPKTSKTGNTYFVYERSRGTDARGRSLDPAEYENYDKVFGRKLHWSMWGSQRDKFMDSLEKLTDRCGGCQEGDIMVYAYECSSCGFELANHKKTPITEDVENSLRDSNTKCPDCDKVGKAASKYECVKQEGYGARAKWVKGCDNPSPVEVSSVDITVRAQEAGNSQLIEILDFEEQENLDLPEFMTTPFDFDYIFGSISLEDQARALGKENPFDDSAQGVIDNFFIASPDKEDQHSSAGYNIDDIPF
jgi:hypothetical protein